MSLVSEKRDVGQLRAGVGRVSITPAIGTWLVGYMGRTSGCADVHDELFATALVLDDGVTLLALLSCDLGAIHSDVVAQVRALVEGGTGVPAGNVMVSCTHTHSGPPGFANEGSRPIDQAYVAGLPPLLAEAVKLAADNLVPVRLGCSSGTATIGINRRETTQSGATILGANLDGPIDSEIGVLRIDARSGEPLCVIVNYACHLVTLSHTNLAVSADFVGKMRELVEDATGATMFWMQGACGDVNPIGGPSDDFARCDRLGSVLAEEVIAVYSAIQLQDNVSKLAVSTMQVNLPLALRHSRQVDEAFWAKLDRELPWAAETSNGSVEMEMQLLAFGDIAIVAMACESFVEIGLACKALSPFMHTFFAGYTNGCVGYLTTAEAFEQGGYEIDEAHLYYRLPAPFAPEAETVVVQACADAFTQIRSKV